MEIYGKGHDRLYFGHWLVKEDNKFWNAFGLFDRKRATQHITVEINFSLGDGRTEGLIAEDNIGRRFLLHSGRVGGGKKGVSKENFLAWLKPELTSVELAGQKSSATILIGEVGARNFAGRLESFVHSVRAFKDAVDNGLLDDPSFVDSARQWNDYRKEFSGRKRGTRTREIDYVSYHGDVVEALRHRLQRQVSAGERITNSPYIDLLVHRNGDLVSIYEVKTSVARQALYTAIGQLVVHSAGAKVKQTLVVPDGETVAEDIGGALRATNIRLMRYLINRDDSVSIQD